MTIKYDYSMFVSNNFRFIDVETGLLSFYIVQSYYGRDDDWFLPAGLVLFDKIRVPATAEDRQFLKHHEDHYRILCGYESHVLEVSAKVAGCEFHPSV